MSLELLYLLSSITTQEDYISGDRSTERLTVTKNGQMLNNENTYQLLKDSTTTLNKDFVTATPHVDGWLPNNVYQG